MLIIAVVVLFILAGIGSAVFALSTQNTHSNTPTPVASASIGTVQFSRSANAIANNFDQVQIELHNVPNPPAGRVYYAWIESQSEVEQPHWQLTVNNGTITTGTLTFNNKNLLTGGSILLITDESTTSAPVIPYPTARHYYASLTSTTTTSFSIKSCPTGGSNNICAQ